VSVPPAISEAVRAGRRARRRGARGELQVVEILKAHGWLKARRNLGRDERRSQAGRDIVGGPEGTRISVKLTERLKLREAYKEVAANVSENEIPMVWHRCNAQPWLATLPLDDLLELLAWRERG
jgi:hypothetical protein